jgi:hypothetical protein
MNGVTAESVSEYEQLIYLESNYFHSPKELYLVFDKLQAIDKDKSNVVIDLEKERILSQPKGGQLQNLTIEGNNISVDLMTEKDFNSFIFGTVTDANGYKVDIYSSTKSTYHEDGKTRERFGISIDELGQLVSPISIELTNFPEWIVDHKQIQIK